MKGFFTAKGINGAINVGVGACLINCISTLVIACFLASGIFYIALDVTLALVWLGLGFGLYKKSQVCAFLAPAIYMLLQFLQMIDMGYTRFNLLWIYFIFSYSYAFVGIRLYHKMKKEGVELRTRLKKETLILFFVMSGIFFGSFPISTIFHERLVQKAWLKYTLQVEKQKEALRLPVKIDKDVYLRDIYFEDKTLIFEYDVKSLNHLPIKEWYGKTKQDFSRFCLGPINVFNELHVIYRFTQGYDKREFNYDARDCLYP